MSKEIIEHQCFVNIRKVKKISDRRFKTGYRSVETIAEGNAYLYPLYPDHNNPNRKTTGTNLTLDHIDQRKDGLHQTFANAEVNLSLTELARKL